jgi:hypothetical protein
MPYDTAIPKLKSIHMILTRPLRKTREWGPLRDQARRFWYASIIETARKEVESQLLEVLSKRPKDVDTNLSPVVLGERCGMFAGEKVVVVGLPTGSKERWRMWKEEMGDDRRKKGEGRLTRKEEEVAVELGKREMVKKEMGREKVLRKIQREKDSKQQRRCADESNRRSAMKREEKEIEVEEKERVKENEKVRRTERKRVSNRQVILEEEKEDKGESREVEVQKRIWKTEELRRVERKEPWYDRRACGVRDKRGIFEEKSLSWWELEQ